MLAPSALSPPDCRLKVFQIDRPIRVLQVASIMDVSHGGAEVWLMEMFRRLNRQEFVWDFLIHTQRRLPWHDELESCGARLLRIPPPRTLWRHTRAFRREVLRHGPYDLCQVNVPFTGLALRLAKDCGIPIRIAHSHNDAGTFDERGRMRAAYLRLTNRHVATAATHGWACSSRAAAALFGPHWRNDSRWEILPYGLDLAAFASAGDRDETRAELGLSTDALVVGHVGRFHRQKNHTFLLEVAAELARREPAFRLVLIGDGPLRSILERRAATLGIEDRIIWAGMRCDVARLLSAFDVMALPSLFEGLPLVGIEAQAAGLPLVLSDNIAEELDAVPELIQRVGLDRSAETWAETILSMRDCKIPDTSTRLHALQAAGFDSESVAARQADAHRLLTGRTTNAVLPQRAGVLFVTSQNVISGVDTWAFRCAQRLHSAGRRVLIHRYAHPGCSEDGVILPPREVPITDFDQTVWGVLPPANLARYAKFLPATLIPNYSSEAFAAAAELSKTQAGQVRVLGYCHSDDPFYYQLFDQHEPIIHQFVAVSDECAAALAQRYPHRAADILTKPYGVEVPRDLRHSYSSPDEPLRLLYAGRIVELQKNVHALLELANKLDALGVNFTLRVIGDGIDKAEFLARRQLLPAAIRERIIVEPGCRQSELFEAMRTSDVGVLVSHFEGTALFMLECLAQGCVPVVTAVSGAAAVIEQGVNGFSVPIDNLDAMAAAIKKLADDRALLGRMGAAAYASAERYSQHSYDAWLTDLLDRVWTMPNRVWTMTRAAEQQRLRLRHLRAVAVRIPGLPNAVRRAKRVVRACKPSRTGLRSAAHRVPGAKITFKAIRGAYLWIRSIVITNVEPSATETPTVPLRKAA